MRHPIRSEYGLFHLQKDDARHWTVTMTCKSSSFNFLFTMSVLKFYLFIYFWSRHLTSFISKEVLLDFIGVNRVYFQLSGRMHCALFMYLKYFFSALPVLALYSLLCYVYTLLIFPYLVLFLFFPTFHSSVIYWDICSARLCYLLLAFATHIYTINYLNIFHYVWIVVSGHSDSRVCTVSTGRGYAFTKIQHVVQLVFWYNGQVVVSSWCILHWLGLYSKNSIVQRSHFENSYLLF